MKWEAHAGLDLYFRTMTMAVVLRILPVAQERDGCGYTRVIAGTGVTMLDSGHAFEDGALQHQG